MENCTFITQANFPVLVEESIDTIEFLNAARGLVWLIDKFGFGFEPVKNDLHRNIEKLSEKYEENMIEHRCLKQMLLIEKLRGEKIATESLLWLRRGLAFIAKFLAIFLEKERIGEANENLSEILTLAYDSTLKSHHGWITQMLFKALSRRCPTRSKFLEILGYQETDCSQTFHSMLDNYLSNLLLNLDVLVVFCRNHGIKPYH